MRPSAPASDVSPGLGQELLDGRRRPRGARRRAEGDDLGRPRHGALDGSHQDARSARRQPPSRGYRLQASASISTDGVRVLRGLDAQARSGVRNEPGQRTPAASSVPRGLQPGSARRRERSICWPCSRLASRSWTPNFFSIANLTNVTLQIAVLVIVALGMTLVILTEGIDLSLGPVLGLCGVVMAH